MFRSCFKPTSAQSIFVPAPRFERSDSFESVESAASQNEIFDCPPSPAANIVPPYELIDPKHIEHPELDKPSWHLQRGIQADTIINYISANFPDAVGHFDSDVLKRCLMTYLKLRVPPGATDIQVETFANGDCQIAFPHFLYRRADFDTLRLEGEFKQVHGMTGYCLDYGKINWKTDKNYFVGKCYYCPKTKNRNVLVGTLHIHQRCRNLEGVIHYNYETKAYNIHEGYVVESNGHRWPYPEDAIRPQHPAPAHIKR